MSVSTAEKISIVARVAARMAGRSRYLAAVGHGVQTAAASCGRILGILWLEVTGFVFLSLAVIGGFAFAHEYAKYQAGKTGSGRMILSVCFILTFAWFGVSSFWRARRANSARTANKTSTNVREQR